MSEECFCASFQHRSFRLPSPTNSSSCTASPRACHRTPRSWYRRSRRRQQLIRRSLRRWQKHNSTSLDFAAQVEILSDDRIIVREHSIAKMMVERIMRAKMLRRFSCTAPVARRSPLRSPARASLQRIFVLEHGQGNVLTRLTKSQAVAELYRPLLWSGSKRSVQ